MDISDILRSLAVLRRRMRTVFLIHGTGSVLIWAVGLAVFLFAADYFLILPGKVRLVLLGAGAAVLVWMVYRKIVYPQARPLSDDDMALCVERTHPRLGEKLISTVQLARRMDSASLEIHSGPMVERTAREAVEEMRTLPLGPVVRSGGALRVLFAGVVLLAGLVLLGSLHPDLSSIWLNRLFGGTVKWPQRTGVEILEPATREIRIARGENLIIKARVTREVPSRVRVFFDFTGSGEEGEADLVRLEPGVFQYFFPNVVSDFEFRVQAGDAETPVYAVRVLVPPKVTDVRVRFSYPPHTRLEGAEPPGWDQEEGNIKAPIGTVAEILAETSKEVREGNLRFSKRSLAGIPLRVIPGPAVAGRFVVNIDGSYTIRLVGPEGLSNRIPARFSIRALPDQAPVVTLGWPRTHEQITPAAVLPVSGVVRDDYGVASVRILLRRTGVKPKNQHTIDVAVKRENYGEKELDLSHRVEIPGLELLTAEGRKEAVGVGDTLLLRLAVEDFRPDPGPNVTRTREVQLEVVTKEELERAVESRMIRLKERLNKIRRTQEKVREKVKGLRDALGEEKVWDRGDLENLLGCEVTQRRVTRDAQRVHTDFGRIRDTVVFNKLGDPEYIRKLEEISEMMGMVTEEKSPMALKKIEAARLAKSLDDQTRAAGEALESQDAVLQILNDIYSRMEKWEDYNEVVRLVRELRESQEAIRRRTEEYSKEKEKNK
jgi:hypothetical protein